MTGRRLGALIAGMALVAMPTVALAHASSQDASLTLDRLAPGVIAAVAADPMRKLGLMALWALGVRGRLRLPVRRALVTPRLALLLLRNRHPNRPLSDVFRCRLDQDSTWLEPKKKRSSKESTVGRTANRRK